MNKLVQMSATSRTNEPALNIIKIKLQHVIKLL